MEWMLGKHYEFCDQNLNVKFRGEVLNVSELAIQIQQGDKKLTLPAAIYSALVAIETTDTTILESTSELAPECYLDNRDLPLLLSEKQVAQLIGMSRSFLRQARMEGCRKNRTEAPPFVRIGRAIRYKAEDVLSWLSSHRVLSNN